MHFLFEIYTLYVITYLDLCDNAKINNYNLLRITITLLYQSCFNNPMNLSKQVFIPDHRRNSHYNDHGGIFT